MTIYESFCEGFLRGYRSLESSSAARAGRLMGGCTKKILEGILITTGVLIALKINGCVSNDNYRILHETRPVLEKTPDSDSQDYNGGRRK